MSLNPNGTFTRGTTNGNDRGNTEARRRRRAWLIETYQADIKGFARCYRCGRLVYNPDDFPPGSLGVVVLDKHGRPHAAREMTVDRIIPGCQGGRYVRNNIRPACLGCNASTGSLLAKRGKKR
jgi:hypothetical protein